MQTITIPKQLLKRGDLVVIPKVEYENLMRTRKEKAKNPSLDKELLRALKEVKQGKLIGPFTSVSELRKSLSQYPK